MSVSPASRPESAGAERSAVAARVLRAA